MKTYITDGNILFESKFINALNVVLENGKIIEISDSPLKPEPGSKQINAGSNYLCPGFIDIHLHGALGKDTMDGDLDSLQLMSQYCGSKGVTSFFPTTWAADSQAITQVIENFIKYHQNLSGAHAIGLHIEGPYINSKYRGAQSKKSIRNPEPAEYERWFDSKVVKLITCAPEIPGGMEFVRSAVECGIRISIGHSGATFDQVIEAAKNGATQATHLFNGMEGLHHRDPGTVGGLLEDNRIVVQIICDGIHLHPAVVDLIIRMKTSRKTILITDSICGAGLPDGDYEINGNSISVKNGIARNPEGSLAGSTLPLDTAVRNTVKYTRKPLEEIIPMVTTTPAIEMGLSKTKGYIQPGYDADLVLLRKDLSIEKTIVSGQIVFSKN
jgi:N-acetylglucosamine-6-phosphate deacetylase